MPRCNWFCLCCSHTPSISVAEENVADDWVPEKFFEGIGRTRCPPCLFLRSQRRFGRLAGFLPWCIELIDEYRFCNPVVTKACDQKNFGALSSCSRSGVVNDASIDLKFWRRRGYAAHRPDDVVLRSSVILVLWVVSSLPFYPFPSISIQTWAFAD